MKKKKDKATGMERTPGSWDQISHRLHGFFRLYMTSLPPSVLYLVIVTRSSVSYSWFLLPHNYVACTWLQHAWAPPLHEGIFSVLAPN